MADGFLRWWLYHLWPWQQGTVHRAAARVPEESASSSIATHGGTLDFWIGACQLPSEPTARATTSSDVNSAALAWTAINAFARLLNGMVSVGLKALELVIER